SPPWAFSPRRCRRFARPVLSRCTRSAMSRVRVRASAIVAVVMVGLERVGLAQLSDTFTNWLDHPDCLHVDTGERSGGPIEPRSRGPPCPVGVRGPLGLPSRHSGSARRTDRVADRRVRSRYPAAWPHRSRHPAAYLLQPLGA